MIYAAGTAPVIYDRDNPRSELARIDGPTCARYRRHYRAYKRAKDALIVAFTVGRRLIGAQTGIETGWREGPRITLTPTMHCGGLPDLFLARGIRRDARRTVFAGLYRPIAAMSVFAV